MPIIVTLTTKEATRLLRPVTGQGGWQTLTRKLQNRLTKDNKLMIYEGEIETIRRYTEDYGVGGWESRLGGVLNALRREGVDI